MLDFNQDSSLATIKPRKRTPSDIRVEVNLASLLLFIYTS